jgi:hypothetical protein
MWNRRKVGKSKEIPRQTYLMLLNLYAFWMGFIFYFSDSIFLTFFRLVRAGNGSC